VIGGPDVDSWLAAPPFRLPLEAIPSRWRHTVIEVVCARPACVYDRLALLNRVRGALGNALLVGASPEARARLPCPWVPPCALDILFRQRPIKGIRGEKAGAPPPYTLAIEAMGEEIEVRLSLFGLAAESCAGEAADGLVRGLRGGIALNEGSRLAFEPLRREITLIPEAVRPAPNSECIELRFVTPVAPRSWDKVPVGPTAVIRGLFDRVAGLARWSGIAIAEDRTWLETRLGAVRIDGSGLSVGPVHQRRSVSSPAGRYDIPVLAGRLALSGEWRPLWPLLVLGQTAHAGGRATQGLGRYRLEAS
jgi:hypothetical protein